MLWDSMMEYFKSWFNYTGMEGKIILLSLGLALAFGIIWLLGHRPPLFRKPGIWPVAIASALLTVLATTFIYFPLNHYYVEWITSSFSSTTIADMMLLWTIPLMLIIGLAQEGAKMIPMLFWRVIDNPSTRMGVIIGVAAGAGYGIFEAFYGFNHIFAAGWGWEYVTSGGVEALLPFWLQFWMLACQIGISAIVGYGLVTGRGLGFYFLAAFLHALVAYCNILVAKTIITGNQLGIILAVAGALLMAISLWLRWRKEDDMVALQPPPPPPPSQAMPPPPPPPPNQPTAV